jgi:hypothetical protein
LTLSDLSFLAPEKPWPPADKGTRERLEEYRQNEALREGEVEEVWPDLAKILRDSTNEVQDFYINFPWLVTKKTKDIITGEPALFTLPNGDEQVKAFVDEVGYRAVLGEQICDLDSFGDAVQKIYKDEAGLLCIESVEPEHWFPVVKRGTRKIEYHVLAFTFEVDDKCYLEVEIHSKKEIEHRVYELIQDILKKGFTIGKLQTLAVFHPGLQEIEVNPAGDFLVITCHNQRMSGELFGVSSYGSDFKSILKKIIIRYSSASGVLNVFSRPTLVGPRNLESYDPVTGKNIFRPGEYKGVNFDPGTTPFVPQAVVWDGHLGEGREETKALEEKLYIVAELPPAALAVPGTGGYATGPAWRLAMTPLLSKCARMREEIDAAATKAIHVAGMVLKRDYSKVDILWQDGLPKIPTEEAQRLSLLVTAGILSPKAAAIEYGKTEEEAQAMQDDMVGGALPPMPSQSPNSQ